MRKKPKSVSEVLQDLQSNPQFGAKESVRESRRLTQEAAFQKEMEPLYIELKEQLGLIVPDLNTLIRLRAPLGLPIVKLLLKHLARVRHPRLSESIVRALGASGEAFDGTDLQRLFELTPDTGVQWAIANTMAMAPVTGVQAWLRQQVDSNHSPTLRKMLMNALRHRS